LKSLWNDNDTVEFKDDLDYRVYTSNLLGRSDELVLHGGGNTSVKSTVGGKEVLYVKGSGWDLVSIERPGFPAVELNFLQDMAKVESLSDSEMVAGQREAMMDKSSPNPSVEAILHAIIPFKYVDHTHADAVVTLSNNINGEKIIKELYPNYLIMPYIMPGFILAREVYLATKDLDWNQCEGIILHNHGIFTFDDDAKISYEKMIDAVTIAENHLEQNATLDLKEINPIEFNIESLIQIIQDSKGFELSYKINQSPLALNYSMQDPEKLVQGVLTPEHIIRTKRHPLVLETGSTIQNELDNYIKEYTQYFEEFSSDEIMLNPTPNYCVIKGYGIVSFGKNEKEAMIIDDIITHTMKAVMQAQILGAYQSISLKDSFAMEYWELEQAKLK
jgi:rhamnose utilization protein RhaD (predicted bifunctional aldolase and dehydrogenase)